MENNRDLPHYFFDFHCTFYLIGKVLCIVCVFLAGLEFLDYRLLDGHLCNTFAVGFDLVVFAIEVYGNLLAFDGLAVAPFQGRLDLE